MPINEYKSEMAEQLMREEKAIDRCFIQSGVQKLEIEPEEFNEKSEDEVKFTVEINLAEKQCEQQKQTFRAFPILGE